MGSRGRSTQAVRAVAAVVVAAAVHAAVVLVGTRTELAEDTITTLIWIALGVWVLAIVVLLVSVVRSGRGMFLLGGEAWIRVAIAAAAGLVGGAIGWWVGDALQRWTAPVLPPCLAVWQPIPWTCPGAILYQWTPWLVVAALAGLAWTIAASRH